MNLYFTVTDRLTKNKVYDILCKIVRMTVWRKVLQ